MITRRSFIQGLVSLVAAPAVMRVAPIMPVKTMPPPTAVWVLPAEYVEVSMGYSITRKAIDDALYKTQFQPSNLGILESFARLKNEKAVEVLKALDNRFT